jgi:ABC-type polysaccharide/polyol phosphate export permease
MLNDNDSGLNEYNAAKNDRLTGFLSHNIRSLFIYRYAFFNFVSTTLSSRYRRSAIGFFWSLLNPLFTMIIMAVVFSSLYKLPFAQFSLYLFSGLLPWNLITASLQGGSMSIIGAESFLKKVYIPKMLFPMVTIGVELVNFSFNLISLFILAIFFGAKLGWSLLLLPFALLLLVLFLLGIVLIASVLTVFFRDFSHILQVGLVGLFYLTPIMYPISLLSGKLLTVIKFNPFYYFIVLFHNIIYDSIMPASYVWLTCVGFAVLSMGIGVVIFYIKERDIIYRL